MREELLVELARLPENNKILIESHTETLGKSKQKTYYHNLVDQMTG